MITHLLSNVQAAVAQTAPPPELDRHVEGISAIMAAHLCYEERQLLTVLDTLTLDADPNDIVAPL